MVDTATPEDDPLASIVANAAPMRSRHRWLLVAGLAALLAAGVLAALAISPQGLPTEASYQTAEVTRGDLVVTVSATGKLAPTRQVDVGSELSGTIEAVYVNNNDVVRKGQVLARLDESKLRDQVTKSRAALDAADAQVLQAEATVRESQRALARLRQVAELSGGRLPAKTELDAAEATAERASANAASARAAVAQAKATLLSDETNLTKASIRSPIDGIVLARKIEPGQTVASSLQSVVVFTLAENLRQMKLEVDVDEADVARLHDGQSAAFTVDAHPGRRYPSRVARVSWGSQTKDNVVSYVTVLSVNNDDLSLRPGMTATAAIEATRQSNVLRVPNAALRFAPTVAPAAMPSRSLVSRLMPGPPGAPTARPPTGAVNPSGPALWVLRDGVPASLPVSVGAAGAALTEVSGEGIFAGLKVITEALAAN